MTMVTFFGILTTFAIISLIFVEVRRVGELMTPLILFFAIWILDIFLPLILFDFAGATSHPYIPIFQIESYLEASIIMLFSLLLFGAGYISVSKRQKFTKNRSIFQSEGYCIVVERVYIVMFFCIVWIFLSLKMSIASYGSIQDYLAIKFMRIEYGHSLTYESFLHEYLVKFEQLFLYVFLMMVMILFYYKDRYSHKFSWGVFFPILGWVLTLLTFQRGTQLNFFIMLYLTMLFSFESYRITSNAIGFNIRKPNLINRTSVKIGLLAFILFMAYGSARNAGNTVYSESDQSVVSESSYLTDSVLMEIRRFVRGEGLLGFTWIYNSYPDTSDYLIGKTYVDMLLLPVPRLIYPSKPEWYGVADITRSMGAPESTQDAVTMPGESYANFGLFGMVLMIMWGMTFGWFFQYRYSPRFKFIYIIMLSQLVTVTAWMSFTGFMNSVKNIPIYMLILLFVLVRRKNYPD
jgi:hypothetical protein